MIHLSALRGKTTLGYGGFVSDKQQRKRDRLREEYQQRYQQAPASERRAILEEYRQKVELRAARRYRASRFAGGAR